MSVLTMVHPLSTNVSQATARVIKKPHDHGPAARNPSPRAPEAIITQGMREKVGVRGGGEEGVVIVLTMVHPLSTSVNQAAARMITKPCVMLCSAARNPSPRAPETIITQGMIERVGVRGGGEESVMSVLTMVHPLSTSVSQAAVRVSKKPHCHGPAARGPSPRAPEAIITQGM